MQFLKNILTNNYVATIFLLLSTFLIHQIFYFITMIFVQIALNFDKIENTIYYLLVYLFLKLLFSVFKKILVYVLIHYNKKKRKKAIDGQF